MKKNLTLRINEDLVEFAHNFSQETNQSISHMIEKYLSKLKKIQEQSIKDKEVSKRIEKLYGAFESNKIPDKQNF